ncbi:MAG: hypothetical protein WCZ23_02390 [Rhodospirillaceae bacterium]
MPSPRLLPRLPSRALAEAMGAAATCLHAPCAPLPRLWPDLARTLVAGASAVMVHALSNEAVHAGHACHLNCPAVTALRDIAALLDAEPQTGWPVVSAA